MLPALIKVAAVLGAAHFITKKRKRKRSAGAVGNCSRCGKRAQLKRTQGMVGACCSSCAEHGGSCDTEDVGASAKSTATERKHKFWDKFHRTAPVGSRFRRSY